MAHTVGFGKLERPILSIRRLPGDVQEARIDFKKLIRKQFSPPDHPGLTIFENGHHRYAAERLAAGTAARRKEQVLPTAAHGETYFEYDVGEATAPTAQHNSTRGCRRLVALVDAGGNVRKMYFTEDHYDAGSWYQLQYP